MQQKLCRGCMEGLPAAGDHSPMAKKPRKPHKPWPQHKDVREQINLLHVDKHIDAWNEANPNKPKLTQRAVAEAAGISEAHLSLLIKGTRGASRRVLQAIAAVFGVSVGELYFPPGGAPLSARIAKLGPRYRDKVSGFLDGLEAAQPLSDE